MKKRLASKKGFTLVECLVAIVIFSIMALMVSMMYSMSLTTYKNARDIDTDLSAQEHDVVLENRYAKKYSAIDKESDNLKVNFQDDSGNSIVSLSYPFEARKSSAYSEEDSSLLLSYAVANVDYADSAVQESDGGGGGGGGASIPSDVNPTIYGSSEIKYISLYDFKQETHDVSNEYKYSFKIFIDDDFHKDDADAPYRQIKINLNNSAFNSVAFSGEADLTFLKGNMLRIGGKIKKVKKTINGNTVEIEERTPLDSAVVNITLTTNKKIADLKGLQTYFGEASNPEGSESLPGGEIAPALIYNSQTYKEYPMPGVYAFTQKEAEEDTP